MNQIKNILRSCHRGDKLNIICTDVHERYQSNLSKTGHNFYSIQIPGLKTWERTFAPVPPNYHILDIRKPPLEQLPPWVDFDLALSGHKFGCFQTLKPLADRLGIPLISIEHTTAEHLPRQQVFAARQMVADVNLFISDYSMKQWGWGKEDGAMTVLHGVDSSTFCPNPLLNKDLDLISVGNDIVNRSHLLGYDIMKEVVKGLPFKLIGRNPGLSEETKTVEELVNYYQRAKVYLNTSVISPIPMSMLEAMSCGLAVVALPTCSIPEIIKQGVNGVLARNAEEARKYCIHLLQNPLERDRLGQNARKTIEEKYSLAKFVENWNEIFARTVKIK